MKITCNEVKYCCDEMENATEMGYILYNDKRVYFYYSNLHGDYIDKDILFCPFCGGKIEFIS